MKPYVLILAVAGAALAGSGAVIDVPDRLMWNRTASAPPGLYWLSARAYSTGDWVVVSRHAPSARWAQRHALVGPHWPLLKRVSGLPGDEICRAGAMVFINGRAAARALTHTQNGIGLPIWHGCFTLADNEVFLLNDDPRSLDGRYFGATPQADIDGAAIGLLVAPDR